MDFSVSFIHWISLCVTTSSFRYWWMNNWLVIYKVKEGCDRVLLCLRTFSSLVWMCCLSCWTNQRVIADMDTILNARKLALTHLNFVDDLLVFTDNRIRSISRSLIILEEYLDWRSVWKKPLSIIYYAGMQDNVRQQLDHRYNFTSGALHVRLLGLPLLTRRMVKTDYGILIEDLNPYQSLEKPIPIFRWEISTYFLCTYLYC